MKERLEFYTEARKIYYGSDCNLDMLTGFRATWKYGPRTASKHIERLRSYLLHPPLLDEVGLASGLRTFLQGFMERSKIKVEFEIPDDFVS